MTTTFARIKGAQVHTVIDGRTVDVVFRSPYRWRVYEGARDVTTEFGCRKVRMSGPVRGAEDYTLTPESPEWRAFHDKVKAGEISQRIW